MNIKEIIKGCFFTFILVFCSSCTIFAPSPETVYEKFKNACSENDLATAESYVSEDAIRDNQQYGVCILLPDGILTVFGLPSDLKNPDPEVEINGNTAYLYWWWNNGREVQMTMYRIDGKWKIKETLLLFDS